MTEDQNAAASDQNAAASDQNVAASVSAGGFTVIFSYDQLAKATSNFDQNSIIGRGTFGHVYEAKLQTGQIVAVKKRDDNSVQGDRQFLHEIIMLSILHHPNIVNLIGFSSESVHGRAQRLLVYEFMPLGSLDNHLHDKEKKPLDWKTRMKIALGIAKGLNYLHNEVKPCVVFGDLCTANILLDKSFHPRLSDFGHARFGPMHEEYYATAAVKYDVYAYGSVLLELITGQRTAEIMGLFDWLHRRRSKLNELLDPRLEWKYEMRSLCRAADVALACLFEDRFIRPTMCDVVRSMTLAAFEAQRKQIHS